MGLGRVCFPGSSDGTCVKTKLVWRLCFLQPFSASRTGLLLPQSFERRPRKAGREEKRWEILVSLVAMVCEPPARVHRAGSQENGVHLALLQFECTTV